MYINNSSINLYKIQTCFLKDVYDMIQEQIYIYIESMVWENCTNYSIDLVPWLKTSR